jgi:hypothetical protein
MLYTKNSFEDTQLLTTEAETCIFAHGSKTMTSANPNTVLCSFYADSKRSSDAALNLKLVRSTDFFKTHEIVPMNGGVVGMGVKERFLIVAIAIGDDTSLMISMDGSTFAHAIFPVGAKDQFGYTVMDSSFSSITVDTLLKTKENGLPVHGNLYFSNSNGTYFKVSSFIFNT